jgi:hypothetical protein
MGFADFGFFISRFLRVSALAIMFFSMSPRLHKIESLHVNHAGIGMVYWDFSFILYLLLQNEGHS